MWPESHLQAHILYPPSYPTALFRLSISLILKLLKHTIPGPLLQVVMSEKCTLLWREAHLEVKMYKAHQLRTTFWSWDVERVHAVVARSTFWSQKLKNLRGSEHFWTFGCRFAWQAQGAPCQKRAKCEGSVTVSTTTAATLHSTTNRTRTTNALRYAATLH